VVTAVLQEPEGTRIAGIAATADRLAVQLQGGGGDRVVLVDPRTGALAGRISLAH
jgi:putative heme iron utilization protein